MRSRFADRSSAGRYLARRLGHLTEERPVVLALPRGGVPVAVEVATALDAPLDVLVVRKLGLPAQPELAIGAIVEDGRLLVDRPAARRFGLTEADLERIRAGEERELARRIARYRDGRPLLDLAGKTVVVVDDGLATGSTARVACEAVRSMGASRVVLAVPVAPSGWEAGFAGLADECIAVLTPERLGAVGSWYEDFSQTTDGEVVECLEALRASRAE